jgi:quercetin dioxygenase-like cupin family protein
MRHIGAIVVIGLLVAACGGAGSGSAPSVTPSPSASASAAVAATPAPTYSPKAEGFTSKVLVEKPREVTMSAAGFAWIATGPSTLGNGVSATVSEKESFTASYETPIDRQAADAKRALYLTPDLPPLAAGRYVEGLRLVVVQPGGRSSAHMHPGIEGVLVLEGQVLVRSGGNAPASLVSGQGFVILPRVPVQLINIGSGVARTLVYSISPEGAPFSTELTESP